MDNPAYTIDSPNLTKTSLPKPMPQGSQVLVRIHAAALNARDLLVINDSPNYPVRTAPGLVPCSDGAGIIEAVGPDSSWTPGGRVIIHPNTWLHGTDVQDFEIDKVMGGGNVPGTLQKYLAVDDEQVIHAPANLSLEGAPVYPRLLAVAQGTTVIATSSCDQKLGIAKRLGATHLVNYRKTPNWAEEVLRITGERRVDHVVDVAGSATIEQSLKSTRLGGLVSVVGVLTMEHKADLVPQLLFGAKTARGVLGAGSKMMAEELVKLVEQHDIHPVIVETFRFENTEEAFKLLEKQSRVGKIVIRLPE